MSLAERIRKQMEAAKQRAAEAARAAQARRSAALAEEQARNSGLSSRHNGGASQAAANRVQSAERAKGADSVTPRHRALPINQKRPIV